MNANSKNKYDSEEVKLASRHFSELLRVYGVDLSTEEMRDTPLRYARFLGDFLTPETFNFTTFDSEGTDEMVIQRDIPWYSLCAHHTLPMFGTATVAYLPNKRLAGLSKLARTVTAMSKGFQTQERITQNIAKYLYSHLDPGGVGVVLKGTHMCMTMRGAKAHGTTTTTSCLIGAIKTNPSSRQEFLKAAGI
jgi:GTP cyclohydrolase I